MFSEKKVVTAEVVSQSVGFPYVRGDLYEVPDISRRPREMLEAVMGPSEVSQARIYRRETSHLRRVDWRQ